jgi:hypothetical protein
MTITPKSPVFYCRAGTFRLAISFNHNSQSPTQKRAKLPNSVTQIETKKCKKMFDKLGSPQYSNNIETNTGNIGNAKSDRS